MKLEQFTFKKSNSVDYSEEAIVVTNKDSNVTLLKDYNGSITVRKTVGGIVKSDCSFPPNAGDKLNQYLKNIGKK